MLVHRFESVSSTNDLAIRMAEEGDPEGTVVVALEQTSGRGRLGRTWSSPPGDGLYLSIILRPNIAFGSVWQMAFVAALAAAEAIRQVSGLTPEIKWPNDVLLNGRKVCGILVEARKLGEMGRPVIIGIGANLNNREFPPEIADTATSIMLETGQPVSPRQVEEALLSCLDRFYTAYLHDGFAPILDQWKTLDCTAGRRVSVVTDEGVVDGAAQEVDSNGDLIVRRDDGTTARVTAGEVILHGS